MQFDMLSWQYLFVKWVALIRYLDQRPLYHTVENNFRIETTCLYLPWNTWDYFNTKSQFFFIISLFDFKINRVTGNQWKIQLSLFFNYFCDTHFIETVLETVWSSMEQLSIVYWLSFDLNLKTEKRQDRNN